MRILYLGTLCSPGKYEALLNGCKVKPSVASVVFERALMSGFAENNSSVDVLSYPMVPTFPKSQLLYFGGDDEIIEGYTCHFLGTINLPILKQLTRRISACRSIKKWAKKNAGKGVILTYSIPPFLAKDLLYYRKKYKLKIVAIIPDLIKNMYINHKSSFMINTLRELYLKKALAIQGEYDGYVYLTEGMRDEINDKKPYIVMEGILDRLDAIEQSDLYKSTTRAIMYAGRMHEKYGVLNLVEAFRQVKNDNIELWLFGDGSAVNEIICSSQKDHRIKYFGSVTRQEVLLYEKQATLLVNPRSTKEQFTKYSFPSKTIEYMASGTPLLTTRLEGIPSEYFDHSFSIEDNAVCQIKDALVSILNLSDEELKQKGKIAQQFVRENKNAKTQSERIVTFLLKLVGEKNENNCKG